MHILLLLLLTIAVPACTCEPKQSPPRPEKELLNNKSFQLEPSKPEKVQCPVCGLEFDKSEARAKHVFKGVEYYFLLQDHYSAFKAAPETYSIETAQHVDNTTEIAKGAPDGGSGRMR